MFDTPDKDVTHQPVLRRSTRKSVGKAREEREAREARESTPRSSELSVAQDGFVFKKKKVKTSGDAAADDTKSASSSIRTCI